MWFLAIAVTIVLLYASLVVCGLPKPGEHRKEDDQ
jgi:cytochrome c biogenesis protein ResB